MLKKALRALAALCLLGVIATWFALGANRGWTKTSVAIPKIDEITGIEYSVSEARFIPGIEFLAIGIGLALTVAAITFLPIFTKSSSSSSLPS